ncbi:MAG: tail fiber protein, partial [Proteobacteria bacterium]|nr:tail fiber protein [Pseudomonadota bacterium]
TQCSGKKTFVCPGDASKVACDDSAMIGEIKLWAGKTIPKGWHICDGSSLSKTTYKALYDVIGMAFGGFGNNFSLPNFKGRVPVGIGYATSSTYTYSMGSKGGEEKHVLTISEMPSHNHGYTGVNGTGYPDGSGDSTGAGAPHSYPRQSQLKNMGNSSAHENRMPYLAVYYIIYTGVY